MCRRNGPRARPTRFFRAGDRRPDARPHQWWTRTHRRAVRSVVGACRSALCGGESVAVGRHAVPTPTQMRDSLPMDRVRIGIIGVGNIATLNVPGYLEHDQCEVVALCDPRPEVLDRRRREWEVGRGYAEVDALLADDEIDAVEVLSPTPLHAQHAIAALRAGKHVSVQKPIANSVNEARRMIDEPRPAGKVFRVTENCCHFPPLEKA